MLFTNDLLTSDILNHKYAAEAFTLMRTLEDVSIEQRLEAYYPKSKAIFEMRAQFILPIYKKHVPTKFANEVDQLFLFLRGYTSRPYTGSVYNILCANEYLYSKDKSEKIQAILMLTEHIMKE